ncbi:hypothetical protein K435DRAFT_870220 [Dendrothele bispora CBS 962.96]|uniref:Uncharacterized protein n=1 Tax=Dendrothele bispora (strain CBS 962.96) TaxID=1314807 RepID=A0A4S8L763_DENBC|nr:hypothetical protein K435DRAFT_870220 [Dendrothele bispora CBS 962.96]
MSVQFLWVSQPPSQAVGRRSGDFKLRVNLIEFERTVYTTNRVNRPLKFDKVYAEFEISAPTTNRLGRRLWAESGDDQMLITVKSDSDTAVCDFSDTRVNQNFRLTYNPFKIDPTSYNSPPTSFSSAMDDASDPIIFYDIAPAPPVIPFAPNPCKARQVHIS